MTPSAWMTTTIGGLSAVARGASPRPIASPRWFDNDGEVRWIRIADVNRSDGRTLRETTQALSADGIARSRYLKPGTLIMSIAATVGIPVVTGVPACIHDGFVALEDLKADKRFMLYLLKASEARLREAGQSGSQMNVNSEIVRGLQVTVPSDREEQIRISSALWDADELMDALRRAIAKKRAIKQGMMQELLTGRTRLPGFRDSWRVSNVGDFTQVRAGGTPSTSVPRYWGGENRWMSSGEIHQKRVREVAGRITAAGLRESAAQLLPVGTVLMALAGQGKTRGTVAVSRVELSTNQSIAGILPSDEHDSDFLYYNLDTRYMELRGESTGDGGRGGLNLTIIKKLNIYMPRVEEQRAIARVIGDVDDELEILERRLESTRAIKQGMMQELLTGRTRLPVAEEVSV
ncbi:restriction endonuclease subunit S [Pseudoclavibacter sp. RFBA6]|uniref:restriction endonuclease subunit S n=1 Tax=Pseudoclavibacter sp. RFBA6 TaxID=2080573 RepID=UPI000CE76DD8|nr:restriction endonuclease subunit S [Pseudoclavibacter sp. RFBA6]PPG40489.1 restriction endonuclease subunit S [Pseudoclavibacter sp. RFBA6]